LDVICTHHPLSCTIAHHLVCYPQSLAETRIHPRHHRCTGRHTGR